MTMSTKNSTSLTLQHSDDPHHNCHRKCEKIYSKYDPLGRSICKAECNGMYGRASQPNSQISEKLADSAKNLYDESEKLLLIAEEIHNQDLMYL